MLAKAFRWAAFSAALFLSSGVGFGAEKVYSTSWATVSKLSFDIHKSLKPEYRAKIHSEPVSLETDVRPSVKLEEFPDDTKPLPMIFISVGFVDLINNLGHAQAIGEKNKGYFQKYIDLLAEEKGEMELQPLPGIEKDAYWDDEMLNGQLSNFNSIAGMLVSLNFAHHYLGQFKKYESKMKDAEGKYVPINKLLTAEEYDKAFAAGVRAALEAGVTIEGITTFFEAFDKMKTRPDWAVYFIPNDMKYAKLKKTMAKIQSDFFAGKN